MKTNFKMKEATDKDEAIISICDAMKENPLWLNKCTDSLCRFIIALGFTKRRTKLLNTLPEDKVIDIFVSLKTQYYKHQETEVWN